MYERQSKVNKQKSTTNGIPAIKKFCLSIQLTNINKSNNKIAQIDSKDEGIEVHRLWASRK